MVLIASVFFPVLRWELSGLKTGFFSEDILTKGYYQVGFLLQQCFCNVVQPLILPVEIGG